MVNRYFLFFYFLIILFFSCKKQDITPIYLSLSEKDFSDCIDVSNFNKNHETVYDSVELNIIKQQNFRDVFVSLNGQELGFWNLSANPVTGSCKIPLLPNF